MSDNTASVLTPPAQVLDGPSPAEQARRVQQRNARN
jgi:hypothetical protein